MPLVEGAVPYRCCACSPLTVEALTPQELLVLYYATYLATCPGQRADAVFAHISEPGIEIKVMYYRLVIETSPQDVDNKLLLADALEKAAQESAAAGATARARRYLAEALRLLTRMLGEAPNDAERGAAVARVENVLRRLGSSAAPV